MYEPQTLTSRRSSLAPMVLLGVSPAAPTYFSKKRSTFAAPMVVGQTVSMPRSA
jgi:hypothetical protein